jgi:DNA-binding PadR family transcriptional regulator
MAYRINIFEQNKRFNEKIFSGSFEFRSYHCSLYYFLLNQCNRLGWPEYFKCPPDVLMTGSLIGSYKTLYKALKDLESFGLIEYLAGVNQIKSPKFKIMRLGKKGYANVPAGEVALTNANAYATKDANIAAGTDALTELSAFLHTNAEDTLYNSLSIKIFNLIKDNFEQIKLQDFDLFLKFKSLNTDNPEQSSLIKCKLLFKQYLEMREKKGKKLFTKIAEEKTWERLCNLSGRNTLKAIKILDQALSNEWIILRKLS